MTFPQVFIASSVEGLPIARAAKKNLEYDADGIVWDQGVFTPSKYPLEDIIAQLKKSDFGIFVFSADDDITMRKEEMKAVRDNVLIEFGLFVGHLGRERNFIIQPKNAKLHIPSDLIGLNPATYDPTRYADNLPAMTGSACDDIRTAIKKLGPRIQTVEKIVQQLDERCIKFLRQVGHKPFFSEPADDLGRPIYEHATQRLKELNVLRFDLSDDAEQYAYHWTELGNLLINRYHFDTPMEVPMTCTTQEYQEEDTPSPFTDIAECLSDDAKMILMKARESATLFRVKDLSGTCIQAGDEELCNPDDDRQQKRLSAAFDELLVNCLIEDLGAGTVFEFTHVGHLVADELSRDDV